MSAAETARALLAAELALPHDQIGPDTALFSTAEWNSLAHLRIVLALEEIIKRPLTPTEIISLSGFSDVTALLEK